jgi:hypothetical protein
VRPAIPVGAVGPDLVVKKAAAAPRPVEEPKPKPAPAAPAAREAIPISQVIGPEIVLKRPGTVTTAEDGKVSESDILTTRADVGPDGPAPVVVRRVQRPEEEQELPPTEAWNPPDREPPAKPKAKGGRGRERRGPQPPVPLYDDSYKLVRASELASRAAERSGESSSSASAVVDRSTDLIWWSLAIAGALVLIALLITFR